MRDLLVAAPDVEHAQDGQLAGVEVGRAPAGRCGVREQLGQRRAAIGGPVPGQLPDSARATSLPSTVATSGPPSRTGCRRPAGTQRDSAEARLRSAAMRRAARSWTPASATAAQTAARA